MIRAAFGVALTIVLVAPAFSRATTLACRPGVTSKTYAVRYVKVKVDGAAALHTAAESFASANKLSVSGVEGTDPYKRPPYKDKTTILQSRNYGTVIEVRTDNRHRQAKITIGNNCWAPTENWRPYWTSLGAFLKQSGY